MILSFFGLLRDLAKYVYSFTNQICTRLFYVDREMPSSISIHATLDVIPQGVNHELHKLVVKRKAFVEKWCVVNTWHGDVIIEKGGGIGIGSIVIGPVIIGEKSICSQNCFISGESHFYEDITKNFLHQGYKIKQVVIEDNVWIGSNCVILPGVRIGSHSVIGAGSVVTKDISAFTVAVGNPAKPIKQYNVEKGKWGRPLCFKEI
jgi:acetyltransferase-like isoleucine patch superfamily enzyme